MSNNKSGPDPIDMGKMVDGARLANMLPYLEAEIQRMITTLENRVFQALELKELTPEQALYAWMEKASYRHLLKRLTTRVRIGQTAGERIAPHMEGTDDG